MAPLDRLGLEEGHEIGATEATLPFATDSKARQPTVVGPAPERGLADVEELRGLLDIQEIFTIRCHGLASFGLALASSRDYRQCATIDNQRIGLAIAAYQRIA